MNHAPCIRLFHSGGDVGCRTLGRDGVAGPLLLVDSERALQDIEVTYAPYGIDSRKLAEIKDSRRRAGCKLNGSFVGRHAT